MSGPANAASSDAAAAHASWSSWSMATHVGGEELSRPRAVPIVAFERLTEKHLAFCVRDPALAACAPGQFAMLWLPGVDEVPMGISAVDAEAGTAWFLVMMVGDCTSAMARLDVGSRIGVRGPYGRPFSLPQARPDGDGLLLIGGGTGTAPLLRTVQEASRRGLSTTVVLGARSKDLLVFEDRFLAAADEVHACTDDGSHGFHGFTTQCFEKLIADGRRFDAVLTCGPEKMMHRVAAIAEDAGLPCQVSVERWMKCGVGVCGSCVMGEGIRACVEGPCFDAAELKDVPDFGHYHRSADGSVVPY